MIPIIHEDDKVVVRGHWKNGEFLLYVHPKDPVEGDEKQPLAYWLGDNALIYKPRRGG